MIAGNGFPHRLSRPLILALVDCVFIVGGVFMGGVFRFWDEIDFITWTDYSAWKVIVFILVIQISFYYFDLYQPGILRSGMRTAVRLMEAVGISFSLLAVIYYSIPSVSLGRGILIISLIYILFFSFLWRFAYARTGRSFIRERILIIGNGELAARIAKEIYEHGQDACEIIGFVAG